MPKLLNFIATGMMVLSLTAGVADARHYTHRTHHTYGSNRAGGGHDYYTNVSGHRVHRPVQSSSAPSGATAKCGDGSWSFSENHRGTCSHHGGVGRWL